MEFLVKSLLLCVLIPCAHSAMTLDRRTVDGAWYQYKLREYVTPVEDIKRREAFMDSLRYVIVKNIAHELTGDEYRAGLNSASKLTPRERICAVTVKKKAVEVSSSSIKPADEFGHGCDPSSPKINPISIDWVARKRVFAPGDQACGDCYAWAATYALSSAVAIQRNMTPVDLSVQEAKDCSYHVYYHAATNESFNDGCEGGNPYFVYHGLKLNTRSSMTLTNKYEPYNSILGQLVCNKTLALQNREVTFINHDMQDYPVSDTKLENQLQNGPVVAEMCLSKAAFLWKPRNPTDAYDDPLCYMECQQEGMALMNTTVPPEVSHSILIVGYTAKTWIVQNSYGTRWGYNGIGHITRNFTRYGTRVCNLAYAIYWPIV